MKIEIITQYMKVFTETTKNQKAILFGLVGTGFVMWCVNMGHNGALINSWLFVLGGLAGYKIGGTDGDKAVVKNKADS